MAGAAAPVSGVSVRGRLPTDDVLSRPDRPERLLFVLSDAEGRQVGSFAVDAGAFGGGGRLDERRDVLEIESGVVQLLLVAVGGETTGR